MQHRWVLDVLTDLRAFAAANGLTALAAQLDEARLIAAVEIASKEEGAGVQGHGTTRATEPDFGGRG